MTCSKSIKERKNILKNCYKIIFNSNWSKKRFLQGMHDKFVNSEKLLVVLQSAKKLSVNLTKKKNEITFSEHKEWFHKKILCKDTLLFIMDTDVGLPIGQIRFERGNYKEDFAKVSISIDEFARGKGFALKILRLGLKEVKPMWSNIRKIFAEVEFSNHKSSKAFISAGFDEVESKKGDKRVFLKKL